MSNTINSAESARAQIARLYELALARRLDEWLELWDDDLVISFPLAADPTLGQVVGKAQLREITAEKFRVRETVRLDLTTESFVDPQRVLATLDLHIRFPARGEEIQNRIVCLFTLGEDGRIISMDEFANEAILPTLIQ